MFDIFDPRTCCYAKAIAYQTLVERNVVKKQVNESTRDFRSRTLHHKYNCYLTTFVGASSDYSVNYQTFRVHFQKFQSYILRWGKEKASDKRTYLESFNEANCHKLSLTEKSEHSFGRCNACYIKHHNLQAIIPIPKGWERETNENIVQYTNLLRINKQPNTSLKVLKDCANTIHTTIKKKFQETFKTSYTETLTKIKDFKLQKKPSKQELQKKKQSDQRLLKNSMEKAWNETAVIR